MDDQCDGLFGCAGRKFVSAQDIDGGGMSAVRRIDWWTTYRDELEVTTEGNGQLQDASVITPNKVTTLELVKSATSTWQESFAYGLRT